MLSQVGLPAKSYRYWDAKGRKLDLKGLLEDISSAPSRSVFLLHTCAHNPTGVDPTTEEWEQIADAMQQKSHLAFFDCAYQGFASGDLERDARAIRLFVSRRLPLLCASSFAKNMGLYGERCGLVVFVAESKEEAQKVLSQAKIVVRSIYSNPPMHGALIAGGILSDSKKGGLREQWEKELKEMSLRIQRMRKLLREGLEKRQTPGDWSHLTSQIGMFSFTGLTVQQSQEMSDKYHIYMLKNGRISMAGLNTRNVDYVADCIDKVVRKSVQNA